MFLLGPESLSTLPTERYSRAAAETREQFWIRKLACTLNVRSVYASTRWKLLLHAKVVTPHHLKAQSARLAHASFTPCDAMHHHTQI